MRLLELFKWMNHLNLIVQIDSIASISVLCVPGRPLSEYLFEMVSKQRELMCVSDVVSDFIFRVNEKDGELKEPFLVNCNFSRVGFGYLLGLRTNYQT